MRAVLRTLAQCHSHHILHRDVKPGNFMLASDDEAAPLKAIDFGLAVPFDPAALPMTELGLEGTPWCVPVFEVRDAGVLFWRVYASVVNVYIPLAAAQHTWAWSTYCVLLAFKTCMYLGSCSCSACRVLLCKRRQCAQMCPGTGLCAAGGMECMSARGCARAGSWRQRY